ncbi:MAG: L-aspartate oxidase [Hyphomicrobium sp.]|nr:L-aspartate oxidase [Hyphomicrobium sp.]
MARPKSTARKSTESPNRRRAEPRAFRPFETPGAKFGPGDVVVIGAGLAGLYTALKLAPLPVTVVTAAPLGEGASSVWAQGGIAAAVGEGDTPAAHAADTIAAGAGIVDPDVALIVAREAADRVADLLRYGVPFDRDLEGHYVLSREAAHTEHRIVRVSGDRAGAAIMQALIAKVKRTASIRVLAGYEAEDLILDQGRVVGVRLARGAERGSGTYALLPASAVVLATGGIGGLYAVTTNPAYARGESIAFAARAGAVIADPEFVQFHPTALDVGLDPAPLATEALRGEGALLVNRQGRRFMTRLHPDAELAPRDIVARGVHSEIATGRGAYLDCRNAIGAAFEARFPTVFGHCRAAGLDPTRDVLPVAPAAHYHMGGVATDLRGRTSVEGLWAAGEVASTGLHGANRLASNSLLEAVVLGARVAADVAGLADHARMLPRAEPRRVDGPKTIDREHRAEAIRVLRRTMAENAGVVRNRKSLVRALVTLRALDEDCGDDPMLANMTLAARFVAAAALDRRESRGGHFRSDYPRAEPRRQHRTFMTLEDLAEIEQSSVADPVSPSAHVSETALR